MDVDQKEKKIRSSDTKEKMHQDFESKCICSKNTFWMRFWICFELFMFKYSIKINSFIEKKMKNHEKLRKLSFSIIAGWTKP